LPFFTSALQDVVAAAGLGRFAIAGHSLGGLVAANYAAFYPGRVRALGLIAPAGFVRTPGLIARVAGACCLRPMRLALPAPAAFVRSGLRRAVHDPQVVPPGDVARACALARDPATARAFLGVYAGARHELARMRAIHERFARYRGPVAIVWGRDDRYITARGLAAAQRVYPHADAALLADCGHCPHLEYPDLVARQLLAAGF
jgi:pimeloyl-ACP methyl ester carboxylesterase